MKTLKLFVIALIIMMSSLPALSMDNNADSPRKNKTKTLIQVFDKDGNLAYSKKVKHINKKAVSKLPKNSLYLFSHENTAYFIISTTPTITLNE